MSKLKKWSFSTICEQFSIINVRWMVEGIISHNFFLVPKSKENSYIENPGLVREQLEAIGFFTIQEDKYNDDPLRYDAQIDEAFKGCVRQCMGQYGFFVEDIDF